MQKEKILSDLYNGKLNSTTHEIICGSEYQKVMENLGIWKIS